MAPLIFICPKTNLQAPTGIETDAQGLSASWQTMFEVHCPHCGDMHKISVSETYIDDALHDAIDQLPSSDMASRRATAQPAEVTDREWQLIRQDRAFCRALTAAIRSGSETAAGVTATVRVGRRNLPRRDMAASDVRRQHGV
jgi:hypothetical protein